MASQLLAVLARPVRVPRLLAISLLASLIAGAGFLALAPTSAQCAGGVCQCWYCPTYEWVHDPNLGVSYPYCRSSCSHGCAGSCDGEDCSQSTGQGGCGPVCGCRDSDCAARPHQEPPTPPAQPTPTPPPPTGCPPPGETLEWEEYIEPEISYFEYAPKFPIVYGQDESRTGFSLIIEGLGGRYEYKRRETKQICRNRGGDYPADCPAGPWRWACPDVCIECYDDPFDYGLVKMRLDEASIKWIEGELAAIYPGAKREEALPNVWTFDEIGGRMAFHYEWHYASGLPDYTSTGPVDPGLHVGRVEAWTQGTPRSQPFGAVKGFGVPVHLLDATIGE